MISNRCCRRNRVEDIGDIPTPQQHRVSREYNIGYTKWIWEYGTQDFSETDNIFVQSVKTLKYDIKINLTGRY